VALRLEPADVPVWLRPGPAGRIALATLALTNATIGFVSRQLPEARRNTLRDWRRRFAGRRGHSTSVSTSP
jgi:hypothetical protein